MMTTRSGWVLGVVVTALACSAGPVREVGDIGTAGTSGDSAAGGNSEAGAPGEGGKSVQARGGAKADGEGGRASGTGGRASGTGGRASGTGGRSGLGGSVTLSLGGSAPDGRGGNRPSLGGAWVMSEGGAPVVGVGGSTVDAAGGAAEAGGSSAGSPGSAGSAGSAGLSSCADAIKNEGETDVDCGGDLCPPCNVGQACTNSADCVEQICQNDTCAEPTCVDAVQNGEETDVDCGGPDCKPCQPADCCVSPTDCASGVCESFEGGSCATACMVPSCVDAVQNGEETDVDCGGPDCDPCPLAECCKSPADCASGVCESVEGGPCATACRVPSCFDGVQNGNESGVDCGGSDCDPCHHGGCCNVDTDCVNLNCANTMDGGICPNTCIYATCRDGLKNEDETDVDCGGSSCAPCEVGQTCLYSSDCADVACLDQVCAPVTCGDGVMNGTETDIDCGGACVGCAVGQDCIENSDCQSGACNPIDSGTFCVAVH